MVLILDLLLIVALALNFVALGVSSIRGLINAVALQGILLSLVPLVLHLDDITARTVVLVVVTILLKGFVIPAFLVYAMHEANIQHESETDVNYIGSLLLGAVGVGAAKLFAHSLPLIADHTNELIVPIAFSMVWTGFLILTMRKKAITQVLGYLVVENGIYLFGVLLLDAVPILVEVGVLLDLFTGVFVMGIIIHHISRAFESSSTEHLTELRE